MSHAHHSDGAHELGHIVPLAVFYKVFVALLVLTGLTVLVSYQDFGVFNLVIAMLVASMKALLVALFFMHLKYENPLTWVYAIFPIALLGTLIAGTMIDNPFRTPPPAGAPQEITINVK